MNTLGSSSPVFVAATTRRTSRRVAWLAGGLGALAIAMVLSVALGTRQVALGDVVDALITGDDSIATAAVVTRIPRTVLAVLVGASLAISGVTMQAVTRNPLAEPGILGVSYGAALAVVIGITFFGLDDPYGFILFAVTGALVAAVFVYAVGSLGGGGATPLKLALAGTAVSAACSSLVSAILLPRVDVLLNFQFWQIGGVGGATWDRIGVAAPFLVVGALICLACAGNLDSLAMGDDVATGLGAPVARTRLVAAAGAVLLCGVATAVAGPIAFVGLVVPHVCRLLVGTDHRWLLPVSALGGAVLLVGSDVVGRIVARPEELEVGIVTAVVGAPVLVWVAGRRRVRAL